MAVMDTQQSSSRTSTLKWTILGGSLGFVAAAVLLGLGLWMFRPNFSSTVYSTRIGGLALGKVAPDFTSTDIQGRTVHLRAKRGRPVLLKFWSPDCRFCREEVPTVEQQYKLLNHTLAFLTVAVDSSTNRVMSLIRQKKITYPVVVDKGHDLMNRYKVTDIPFTYLIDPNGTIRRVMLGTMTVKELVSEINSCGWQCEVHVP